MEWFSGGGAVVQRHIASRSGRLCLASAGPCLAKSGVGREYGPCLGLGKAVWDDFKLETLSPRTPKPKPLAQL
eukprot:2766435-Rhodomonas_salina.1